MLSKWQCNLCLHRREGLTCTAFPNGIPEEIFEREHDHGFPFPGDNGIQFEPSPEIEPEIIAKMLEDYKNDSRNKKSKTHAK